MGNSEICAVCDAFKAKAEIHFTVDFLKPEGTFDRLPFEHRINKLSDAFNAVGNEILMEDVRGQRNL